MPPAINKLYAFIALWFFMTIMCFAHESRPLYIQLKVYENYAEVTLNIPNTVTESNWPFLVLPDYFIEDTAKKSISIKTDGYYVYHHFQLNSEQTLKGKFIEVKYPKYNPSITSILQITYIDNTVQTLVIGPGDDGIQIPEEATSYEVGKQYTWLGITHIWAGIDHLLFLVCLFLIAGFNKKLMYTITGFTLAHSVTLALSTLDWVHVPINAVEACIALSIIFLCVEIIKNQTTRDSLTYKYPVLVASSFGLLHGFGFAAVLNDIGLPKTHLTHALLFFNIGVEIGQVMFLIAIVAIQFIILKLIGDFNRHRTGQFLKYAVYLVGIIASFWFFDRL